MMTKPEIQNCLKSLELTQNDAAKLLSVSPRTFRRWVADPLEMPGPAEQALRAWVRLSEMNLPWHSSCQTVGEEDPKEIAKLIKIYREHTVDIDAVIQKVNSRGGPEIPWDVDLEKRRATLGPISMTFYPLKGGFFSTAHYTRRDKTPDRVRDRALLEDAVWCIAKEIEKEGPKWD